MARRRRTDPPRRSRPPRPIAKVPTGIAGFDQITGGGLPRGRTTLVCGGPGCGKTLFAIEFVARGAARFDEPGVFVCFEETREELIANVASLGLDLAALEAAGRLAIDHVRVDRAEIQEAGAYDLEGLFVRLGHALDAVGARRIAIDTLEVLFSGFEDEALLRAELRRLFRWLKERGVTAVITGERGDGQLTRHGLEEYVSDCVVRFDNRVVDQVSTRHLQIVKYRGSAHGGNEYPFLIDSDGITVLPVTSVGLDHAVSIERVSTGVPALDAMLDGGGYFRGSSVLISGTAGTGKSSLAALFADACCRRGKRVLYFALEESSAQLTRNLRSIGLDLARWQRRKRLHIHAARPTAFGLEMHLVAMHKLVETVRPSAVVVDPISSLADGDNRHEVRGMLVRLLDYLKTHQITCVVTALTTLAGTEESIVGISSLIDSWIRVRDIELAGERTRGLYLVKSRGMGHSNQVREFVISSHGVDLLPVAIGPAGVITGSARAIHEAEIRERIRSRARQTARRERALARRLAVLDAQIAALRAEQAAAEDDVRAGIADDGATEDGALAMQVRAGQDRTAAPRARGGGRS